MKLKTTATLAALTTVAFAQHTIPNTWTPLIGGAQGWPQDTEGRAIHMIHVPPTNLQMGQRGNVVFFGVSNSENGPVTPTRWMPPMASESGHGTFADTSELSYDAFCCGHTLMEDGRIVITGSNFGSRGPLFPNVPGPQVAIYNPATNAWTEMIPQYELNEARYYPSVYRLTDGRIATFGGQATKTPTAFVPEPYEINHNKLTLLSPWDMPVESDWDFLNYPHLYHVSSTELFFAGPGRHFGGGGDAGYNTFYFDLANPYINPIPYGGLSQLWQSPSVMYKPGFILKAGGVEDQVNGVYETVEATQNAEVINFAIAQSNKWAYVQSMHRKRIDHNMVILPDGRVFAVGGTLKHHHNLRKEVSSWVQDGEIWDPASNTWTLTAAFGGGSLGNVFRGYHSSAILMPDARVLLAGGDTDGVNPTTPQPPSGHFYLPDYGTGTRPVITAAPDTIAIGSQNNVVETNGVANYRVVLVGLGSVTHSLDSNQRWVELSLLADGPTDDPVFYGPTSSTQTPVGHYMLFVLKNNGAGKWLPCTMAKYVKVIQPDDQ